VLHFTVSTDFTVAVEVKQHLSVVLIDV